MVSKGQKGKHSILDLPFPEIGNQKSEIENTIEGESFMCNHKKTTITEFVIISLIIFSCSTVLCELLEGSQLQIIIIPAEVTLTVGEQLQFRAEIRNDGTVDLSGIDVEWKAMGSIGEISADGVFTASDKPGRGMVRASAKVNEKQLTAYALVKVAEGEAPPGVEKRIVVIVRPDSVVLPPGGSQKFTAEPAGDTQWRAIPPRAGSITPEGIFTASQNSGKGIVVATVRTDDGTGTGRANILVSGIEKSSPGPKLKLHIKPKHAQVDLGGSADFEVEVTGLKDQYPLEWEVNPAELGHTAGTGGKVSFVAGNTEGRALVTVKLRTETEIGMDWATVDVGRSGKFPPAKIKVSVIPQDASIKAGESMLFAVNIVGNAVARSSWSVAPKKIGIIDENGLFTAAAPGWGLVIAKVDMEGGIGVGQAKVFVGTETSMPLRVTISPQNAETRTNGDPVKFAVTDVQGRPVTDMPIHWKVVPGNLGSMDQTGTFVPGSKAGHALITAKVEGAEGSGMAQARVTITSHIGTGRLRVTIDGPDSLTIGSQYVYNASVTDSEGGTVKFTEAEFKCRVVPSKLGTVVWAGENAIFTPSVAGRGVIIVEVEAPQGTGTGRISITVEKK
jgi:hypothetical protein